MNSQYISRQSFCEHIEVELFVCGYNIIVSSTCDAICMVLEPQMIFPFLQYLADKCKYPLFPSDFEHFLDVKFEDKDYRSQFQVSLIVSMCYL